MRRTPISINADEYPAGLLPFISDANLYDSSCSPEARVIFINKDDGYFLKSAAAGKLEREAVMTRYFHEKGLAAEVVDYIPGVPLVSTAINQSPASARDWLLTAKLPGDDCTAAKYLERPERLCDILAEKLAMLHAENYSDCPVQNHAERYLAGAEQSMRVGTYDKSHFPDSFGYKSAAEAWAVVETQGHLLKTDTLLHGDYCLPNTILDDWRLSGFIDLDNAGVGDRHVYIFWGLWSLAFNLKTDKYRQRFIDAYGRAKVDEDILRIVAAAEVFG